MTALIRSGAEMQIPFGASGSDQAANPDGGWDSPAQTNGSIDTVKFYSGAASFKMSSGASGNGGTVLFDTSVGHWSFTSGNHYYLVWRDCFDTLNPTGSRSFFGLTQSGGNIAALRLSSTNNIELYNSTTSTVLATSSAAIADTTTFHELRFGFMLNTGSTSDFLEAYLDGVLIGSTTTDLGNTAPSLIKFGWMPTSSQGGVLDANFIHHFDDICLNDDQGANENTYSGERIWLLTPTSDASRTGWTAGSAGTTNLWDAINNTPPVGVANGSITTTSQIRDTTANTTDTYQANMTTYTAAGIPSTDTISVVQLISNSGESGGASSVAFQGISNPAITEETQAASSAVSTWPTNWLFHQNAAVYNPTVTRGTAPVVQARRASSTNNTHVDFMGLMVSSTPAVPAPTGVGFMAATGAGR